MFVGQNLRMERQYKCNYVIAELYVLLTNLIL